MTDKDLKTSFRNINMICEFMAFVICIGMIVGALVTALMFWNAFRGE